MPGIENRAPERQDVEALRTAQREFDAEAVLRGLGGSRTGQQAEVGMDSSPEDRRIGTAGQELQRRAVLR